VTTFTINGESSVASAQAPHGGPAGAREHSRSCFARFPRTRIESNFTKIAIVQILQKIRGKFESNKDKNRAAEPTAASRLPASLLSNAAEQPRRNRAGSCDFCCE
jgi:hypothetical protein